MLGYLKSAAERLAALRKSEKLKTAGALLGEAGLYGLKKYEEYKKAAIPLRTFVQRMPTRRKVMWGGGIATGAAATTGSAYALGRGSGRRSAFPAPRRPFPPRPRPPRY